MTGVLVDVVIPTLGRASLADLLVALADQAPASVGAVVVVDDRRRRGEELTHLLPPALRERAVVIPSGGRGPAAARNVGWRRTAAPWVVFLDDDVVPETGWGADLVADLQSAPAGVGAVQGHVVVPLPAHRRATDRERNVARLEHAAWITADLAVRREVLDHVGGFDERFPRAYREDTDFHLRASGAGCGFARGRRRVRHPVGPAPWWASIAAQRGNADDALLRALHGPGALERGRRNRHQLVTASLAAAVLGALAGRRRAATAAAVLWAAGTAELAAARVREGSRRPGQVAAMIATSIVIPPAATSHWWRGRWRSRGAEAIRPAAAPSSSGPAARPSPPADAASPPAAAG